MAAYLKKDKQNSADVRVSKHSKESMRLLMTIPLKRCRRRRNAGAIMKIPNMVGNDASQSTVRNKNPYNRSGSITKDDYTYSNYAKGFH